MSNYPRLCIAFGLLAVFAMCLDDAALDFVLILEGDTLRLALFLYHGVVYFYCSRGRKGLIQSYCGVKVCVVGCVVSVFFERSFPRKKSMVMSGETG